jgi:hypothetical protein
MEICYDLTFYGAGEGDDVFFCTIGIDDPIQFGKNSKKDSLCFVYQVFGEKINNDNAGEETIEFPDFLRQEASSVSVDPHAQDI